MSTSEAVQSAEGPKGLARLGTNALSWLQAAPLTLVLGLFLIFPIVTIIIVSFWDYSEYALIPDLILENYTYLLSSPVTWSIFRSTLGYAAASWVLTLLIGFTVAYFLAFHVRTLTWQIVLFMVCTIPFWTSNVIRMISWIPVLGRNGLVNQGLMGVGIIDHPLEFLLFSDFAVILAFVHLYTLFMVVPIFNSMMRIDRSLLEAAADQGASAWQTLWSVIVPLCRPGIVIGSIFVVTLVMGDFITVRLMSGGQGASVGVMMNNEISLLQYPAAAADAVVLLAVVLLMVFGMLKAVDIRREL
jgi:putative spermidine/putrescine transport system permease protein